MAKRGDIHVRVRIDFDSGASFGPGKVALLERIAESGSLSQAARDLGLSYRRGWLLLNDLNHAFGEPVVVTATGGVHGGGARLTALGRQLIDSYREVESASGKAAAKAFRGVLAKATAPGRPADGSLRRPLARRLKS